LRDEIGDVFRADKFDEVRFVGAEAQISEKFRQATGIFRSSLEQMHEILDGRQRARLADWLTSGHHCYRYSHW
jgi:hypothetical protein